MDVCATRRGRTGWLCLRDSGFQRDWARFCSADSAGGGQCTVLASAPAEPPGGLLAPAFSPSSQATAMGVFLEIFLGFSPT